MVRSRADSRLTVYLTVETTFSDREHATSRRLSAARRVVPQIFLRLVSTCRPRHKK